MNTFAQSLRDYARGRWIIIAVALFLVIGDAVRYWHMREAEAAAAARRSRTSGPRQMENGTGIP